MARRLRNERRNMLQRQIDRRYKRNKRQPRWVPHLEPLEHRCMLATGPVLAGITTNDGNVLAPATTLHEAPQELNFRFDENQRIDVTTLDAIQIYRSNKDGQFGDGNDILVSPGHIGIGNQPNDVVLRFSETLPDDAYRVEIDGTSANALRNIQGDAFNDGNDFALEIELDLGAQIRAVVPQPITRNPSTGQLEQARNEIVVYFNDDDLSPDLATNPDFYQLIPTGHANDFDPSQTAATNLVDGEPVESFKPLSVSYDSAADVAVLTFDVDDLADLNVGTYRLRIGTSEATPLPPDTLAINGDPGSSFDTAWPVTTDLGTQGQVFETSIEAQAFPLQLPGSNSDPGHRQVKTELDKHVPDGAIDFVDGITTFSYNFEDFYGEDPQGDPLSNAITERQKQRAREIFELYGHYLGVQFIEAEDEGFTIVNGDVRAIDELATNDPNFLLGLAGDIDGFGPTAVINANADLDDGFGGSWFQEAMRQIGFLLGMGASLDLPEGTIMGGDPRLTFGSSPELVFPGDNDIVHGQRLYRPDSVDIDMYRFTLDEPGFFTAEITAERLGTPSHLDSVLRMYQETDFGPVLIAQNDDYFSQDSFLELELDSGTYFVGVTSKGNDQYDPTIEDTGFGGTTQGDYELRLNHRPIVNNIIRDTTGTAFDGDSDGRGGGVYNYWFRVQTEANTIVVDKSFAPGGNGGLNSPLRTIPEAMEVAEPGDIVRVVGNHLGDNDLTDDQAYEIGRDAFGLPLPDGDADGLLRVKPGVTLMIDAGAVIKLNRGTIVVGSTSAAVDRSGAALQVLGTPETPVFFTSFSDATIGMDGNPLPTQPARGDWGGILFARSFDEGVRFDYEQQGIFLNYVNGADIRYGGGSVSVDSVFDTINPVTMADARATVTNSKISRSADAAMSASANSFEVTNFHSPEFQATRFTSDYTRVGPEIRGNEIVANTTNGLSVFNLFAPTSGEQRIEVTARWDDTDIVHVVSENLQIEGTPGGQVQDPLTGDALARLDASLIIDPGAIVKLQSSWIQTEMGATFLAEGTDTHPVVFTSLLDDRFGFGGTFDTNGDNLDQFESEPIPGDWAGVYIGHTGVGSIDNAVIAYGGGVTTLGGSFSAFNAVEVHQADARITNSRFEFNAEGVGGAGAANRLGLGANNPGAIFVRNAQPVIANNVFVENDAPVVSINANALNNNIVIDAGRQTGYANRVPNYLDNSGPLIRNNQFDGNSINGMEVRGGTLTTESVWDDADIVHVLRDAIYVPNFHTYGGLRLLSNLNESLVVKLLGEDAGFVTTGTALGINDHIGGRIQVLGQPGHPVVMSSLFDDTVGAGFDTDGNFQTDTNNGGRPLRSEDSFRIDINFGPNISLNQDMVDAVIKAASLWEQELQDPITIVIDVEMADLGVNRGGLPGGTGNNLAQTNPQFSFFTYDEVRTAMISDAGAHEAIVAGLPNFQQFEQNVRLPVDQTNPYSVSQQMRLTRANAKALGLLDGSLGASDGSILLHNDLEGWDLDRKNGLETYREDFSTYVMREIGTILGFVTSVDEVNSALNGAPDRFIEATPLDLFRFEPGQGNDDFTGASRVLDPRVADHVFYAGGDFDPTGWPMIGLEKGDVPLSTGRFRTGEFNDTFSAGYWRDDVFFRDEKLTVNKPLGIMDPVSRQRDQVFWRLDPVQSTEGLTINVGEEDRLAFDVIGYDVVGGTPGDWKGITLERLTHDRNVVPVNEKEGSEGTAAGSNALPSTANFIGTLAEDLTRGGDNQRLGFDISGLISDPNDVDVYSFNAPAGTEVFLDIDRTSVGLDTVLELISATGVQLALSDNSHFEADEGVDLPGAELLGESDLYTSNIYDAGMVVTLPGVAGVTNTYYVRVRSRGADINDVTEGLTQGAYQLQIRLQETDEVSGTVIEFSDIRYADTGIRIVGPPVSSPLTGDHVEDESFNDHWQESITPVVDDDGLSDIDADPYDDWIPDFAIPYDVSAQKVGNLLNSDIGAISVAGAITTAQDVDWYEFRVGYDRLLNLQGNTAFDFDLTAGVVFDIDYADGLSRANLALSVFDGSGNLMYYSTGSDLPDDLHGAGSGPEDLTRGSFGEQDPYIGPVELLASRQPQETLGDFFTSFGGFGFGFGFGFGGFDGFGGGFGFDPGTYYVAVSSIAQVPFPIANESALLDPVLGDPERGSIVTVLPPNPPIFDPNDPFPFFDFCDFFGQDPVIDPTDPDAFFTRPTSRDSGFCLNRSAPANAALTGEYQLEIRYVPVPDEGFSFSNATIGDQNRERDQGQITVTSNSIRDSRQFGLIVEDAPRDYPTYDALFFQTTTTFDEIFDQSYPDVRPHNNFTTADYAPHASPPRNLTSLNEERLVSGLTVTNNLIAEGVEGGLHLQGDPNGIVLQTYDLRVLTDLTEDFGAEDIEGTEFTIWDHHRNTQTFEFDNNGTTRRNNFPVLFDLDPANDGLFLAGTWKQINPPTLPEFIADELEHAIRQSDLDVKVVRGNGNSLFIEGAVEIGHPDVIQGNFDSVFFPDDSFLPILTAFIAQQGPVPFVNVTNNTIVGRGGDLFDAGGIADVGILVEDNASPTILNNILANFSTALESDLSATDEFIAKRTFLSGNPILQDSFLVTGVTERNIVQAGFGAGGGFFGTGFFFFDGRDIDSSPTEYIAARPTVIGANVYQGNNQIARRLTDGDFAINLSNSDPLFVNPGGGNFLLADGSRAIDSAVDALQPREGLASVLEAIGFEAAQIEAPDIDLNGLIRIDDPSVEPPNGLGSNAFKDRGALERADFVGPIATLIVPNDNDESDLNPQNSEVFLLGDRPGEFLIQFTGPDDSSIDESKVTVQRDGVTLVDGLDYAFAYNTTSDVIRLAPLVGSWPGDATYTIILDGSITDPSGNPLEPTRPDQSARFDVALGLGFDFGDAASTFPVTLAQDGARHKFSPNIFLGAGVDVDVDGQPSNEANVDVFDDGVRFDTLLVPGAPAQFTVAASTAGMLSAWLDLNNDGDWSDSGEAIVVNRDLEAGENVVRIPSMPMSSALNDSFQVGVGMRFRFSTDPINSPTGMAEDGEVEDYFETIYRSPWRNPANQNDVNNDGAVSPLDALLIINELNDRVIGSDTGQLPIPTSVPNEPDLGAGLSRFVDVNGDGFVSPVDALNVINALPSNAAPVAAPLSQGAVVVQTVQDESQSKLENDSEQVQTTDEPMNDREQERRRNQSRQRRSREMRPSGMSDWKAPELEDVLTDIAEEVTTVWMRI